MEEDMLMTGALAEILLLVRPLVDDAVASLEEDEPVDAPLAAFQTAIQTLATKEPDVWQLRIVEHIYAVLRSQAVEQHEEEECADVVDDALAADRSKDRTSEALERATLAVCKSIREAVVKLQNATDNGDSYGGREGCEAYMDSFWREMSSMLAAARGCEAVEELEAAEETGSVEILTFDDEFQDDAQSVDSTPTADCIPDLIERMRGTNAIDRAASLDELTQVPMFEVLHCTTRFPETIRAVVGLFLDEDMNAFTVAQRAKQLLYQLLCECEDSYQFLEIYWTVIEFVGDKLTAGDLFLSKYTALEATDPISVQAVDTFRMLLLLLERIPFHWIHFSSEALAKVFLSTFHVLNMYSKLDAEVEVAFCRPLALMACLEEYPSWLQVWLLKAPSRPQLFLALDEIGIVADALQQLSSLQPLVEPRGGPVNAIEKRQTSYLLAVVALVSEYAAGRELVHRWRCLSVHEQLQTRVSSFKSCQSRDLVAIEGENSRLFRLEEGDRAASLEEDCSKESIQHDALAAVVWSIVSIVLLDSESAASETISYGLCQGDWEAHVLVSVARIIAHQGMDGLLVSFLQVLQKCVLLEGKLDLSPQPRASDYFSWCPLREPKSAFEASQLISERILIANLRQGVDSVRTRSRSIVEALLSSSALHGQLVTRFNSAVSPLFQLWQDLLVSSLQEAARCPSKRVMKRASVALRCIPQLFISMSASDLDILASSMLSVSRTLSERESGDTVSEIYTAALVAIGSTASGFRALASVKLITAWSMRLAKHLLEQPPVSPEGASLAMWSRDFVRDFFASAFISDGLSQALAELRESGDFSIAVGSSFDECPPSLRHFIHRFSVARCMLTSRFTPDVLLNGGTDARSTLMNFIQETLHSHGTSCGANSDAEDTCCVAFQFLIGLVSAIPSKLGCCDVLNELGLLDLGDTRDASLREPTVGLGACSYLEHKLRYELTNIGGATERTWWCNLYSVDTEALERTATSIAGNEHVTSEQTQRRCGTASLDELKNKLLVALEVSRGSLPSDSVSQLVWEVIGKIERHGDTRALTSVLGELVRAVIKGDHSPLAFSSASSSPKASEMDKFPPAVKRKMLNRMYKNYCLTLGLPSFPTRLHGVVKQFGNAAIDCFPVTMLMLLGDVCADGRDTVEALNRLYDSPGAPYLWPSTTVNEQTSLPTVVLTEAVEWVLAREFPQVFHSIRLCKCSVAALVVRWHSQSFWNYFDWDAVATHVCLTVLYGVDFQVYTLVAVLAHIEPEARRLGARHSAEGLEAFLELQELPIAGFSFFARKDELLRLRAKYREQVVKILASGTKS